MKVCCFVLEGSGVPDLGAVDDLARVALVAKRLGGGIVIDDISSALQGLVELAGLRIEAEGEAE